MKSKILAWRNYFINTCNTKVFFCIWSIFSLLELFLWIITSRYDYHVTQVIDSILPLKDLKYIFLCNVVIVVYSLLWGVVCKQKNITLYFIPTLVVPIVFSIMEFINYNAISRFDFCAQIYHFYLLAIVWFLSVSTLLTLFYTRKTIFKYIVFIQNIVEFILLWFAFSIMANAILNGGINDDAIVAICQTNFKEAWYYFWGVNHGVILTCFMVLAFVALFFMLKSCRRNLFTISYGSFKIITRFNLLLLIVAFFILGIGIAANMYLYFKPSTWWTIIAYRRYHFVVNKHNNLMLERQRTRTERSTLGKTEDTPSGIDGLFVLIIGESLDRRYMGCYNPQHKTTPFQSNLRNKQETVFLNKIYACDVQTTKAVPMMLTLNNQYIQKDKHLFSDSELSLSLLDVAQNNGYDVIWISNQERISTHNSVITAIASSASQCIFMEDVNPKTRFDHEIVSVLQNLVFSKRTLVIVHLMGNHFPYGKTYPHDIPFPDNMTAYEKSVYYNDTVIQQITEFFQAHGALLISYVSDHSDAVSIGKVHDPRPNKFHFEMIEIPMWIWTSQVYSHDYPTIIEQLQSIQNKVLTNDLVFNMYIDLMHFQKDPKIDKYSPFSSDFVLNKEPPLSLNGKFIIPNSE